jgi:hypothetical protein
MSARRHSDNPHLVIALASGSGKSWHKMDIPSHIDRMAETPRRLLEVTVIARDDSWEWQVQSQGTVLVSGTGRTRPLATFLGNDARLRLLAEDFGNL